MQTLCLIMINWAMHAGGPLSRKGEPDGWPRVRLVLPL
jgi:hypothetical protein